MTALAVPERTPAVAAVPDPRPTVSVIVPCYNEALVLDRSLHAIAEHLETLTDRYLFELIVVDDGSTDETLAIAEAFAAPRPWVRVLRHHVNFRLGQALRFAFGQSRGDYVVTFDVDLTYSVDHIERLLTAIETEHAKIAVASPYMRGGRTTAIPFRRAAMSKAVNKVLSASAGRSTATVTGMVRAYDGPFIRTLVLAGMGPDINTEVLYKAQILRARVVEIPAHLDWSAQAERMAKRRVSLRVSATSRLLAFFSFLFRPLTYFALPGLVLGAVATWTLGSVLVDTVRHVRDLSGSFDSRVTDAFALTWAERPQSFVIGGITMVLAVQLISLGLLAAQNKRYFEESFQLGTSLVRRVDRLERRR
jgi:glycosyltransferase involved in cell wall biosynthesis